MTSLSVPTLPPPAEQRILLHGILWRTFDDLLSALGNNRGTRLAYDRGVLEIMSPLDLHEMVKGLIAALIRSWAIEREIPVAGRGSWTLRREDRDRGIEPDECFYIQNEPVIRGRPSIDLSGSPEQGLPAAPPPDLAIEVDITNSSSVRMPIYKALGVPEVWRYTAGVLTNYKLEAGEYIEQENSAVLPGFPVEQIPDLLVQAAQVGETAVLRQFAQSARRD